ncbi:MAG: hypothetical protein MJ072_07180, partial [Clostridia bacterium]|nr:hypothetical protein [Clostridia bacterium]
MKKFLATVCAIAVLFTAVACGGETTTSTGGNSSSASVKESVSESVKESVKESASESTSASGEYISADLLDLGADLNPDYYPTASNVQQQVGNIDVTLVFDGTEKGWEALEKEYERLHGGKVDVRLDTNYSATTYPDKVNH